MKISALTFIAFCINGAIDTGRYDSIDIDDVRTKIRAGTIFVYLNDTLGKDIDLTILDQIMEAELLEEWQELEAAVNARKKFGVERRGLPLLIAYLLEGIQRRVREAR